MAANVQKVDLVDIELNSGNIHRSWLNHTIGMADNKGNAFGVRVFRDGEAVTLSSVSVQGHFRDPHGTNISITDSSLVSVSGNVAYVVLPQACYNYEGQFCLAIKLVGGGVTGTMRIVDGMVSNTNTSNPVTPTTVPTYQEILSLYDDMQDAADVANAAIAPEYSDLDFPVVKGELCIYNGHLYRAKQDISSSETWTSGHWETTTFGTELKNEESARQLGDMVTQNDMAVIYNEALPYDAGKIVIKDGVTYLLPNGHTAGTAWASTTKTIINLSDHFAGEASELKSAIDELETTELILLPNTAWNDNPIGKISYDGKVAVRDFVVYDKNAIFESDIAGALFLYCDANKNYIGTVHLYRSIPENAKYFVFYGSSASYARYIRYPANDWLNKIYKRSVNLFDKEKRKPNFILKQNDGDTTGGTGFDVSDYIPVTAGQSYVGTRISVLCWYKSNKDFISPAVVSPTSTPQTAPENAAYARFSFYAVNTSADDFMFVQGNSLPEYYVGYYEPVYKLNGNELYKSYKLSLHDSEISKRKNLYNEGTTDKSVKQYIKGNDGTIVSTTYALHVSAKIGISNIANKKITISSKNNLSATIGYRFLNSSDSVVGYGSYNGTTSVVVDIPVNASWLQISVNELYEQVQVEYGSIKSDYEPYNVTDRTKIIINPTADINDFYNSMLSAFNKGNCDVYISAGTYTYTNSLFESIRTAGKRGVPIGNNNRYFFESGAVIVAEYTGEGTAKIVDMLNYFSPLDSTNIASCYEIHNANIKAKGCIYGIHDESAGQTPKARHYYKNCYVEVDNSSYPSQLRSSFHRAIGGGLGANTEIIIENCYFKCVGYDTDVSYHGSQQGNGDRSKIIVSGNYFENAFGINNPADANYEKDIIYTGNCSATDIVRTDEGQTYYDSWVVRKWNNGIRGI